MNTHENNKTLFNTLLRDGKVRAEAPGHPTQIWLLIYPSRSKLVKVFAFLNILSAPCPAPVPAAKGPPESTVSTAGASTFRTTALIAGNRMEAAMGATIAYVLVSALCVGCAEAYMFLAIYLLLRDHRLILMQEGRGSEKRMCLLLRMHLLMVVRERGGGRDRTLEHYDQTALCQLGPSQLLMVLLMIVWLMV